MVGTNGFPDINAPPNQEDLSDCFIDAMRAQSAFTNLFDQQGLSRPVSQHSHISHMLSLQRAYGSFPSSGIPNVFPNNWVPNNPFPYTGNVGTSTLLNDPMASNWNITLNNSSYGLGGLSQPNQQIVPVSQNENSAGRSSHNGRNENNERRSSRDQQNDNSAGLSSHNGQNESNERRSSRDEQNEISAERTSLNEQNDNTVGRSSREQQSTNEGDAEVVTSSDEEDTRLPLPWIKSRNCFNESKGSYKLTRKIKEIFETRVDEGAGRWALVKQETRDYYFGEFQKYWKWPSKITPQVRAAWNPRAGRCYSSWLSEERKKMKARNGSYKPKWIEEEEWTKLKASWETNEFKTKSKIKSKNRRRGVEGGQADATYGGGSQSAARVMDKMAKDEGRKPLAYELFLQTHETTDAKGNRIGFINKHAESLNATYLKMVEEAEKASDAPNYNAIYLKAFLQVTEQKKRKSSKVLGVASATPRFYPDFQSAPCGSTEATPSADLISEKIMKEFDEKSQHIREELLRLSSTTDRIGNQVNRVETFVLDSTSTQVQVQNLHAKMAQLQADQKKMWDLFAPYLKQQNAQDLTSS